METRSKYHALDSSNNEMAQSDEKGQGMESLPFQTRHLPIRFSSGPALSEDFSPWRQTWQLFKGQAVRLIFTLGLIALYIMTLALWENRNVDHAKKVWFNTIMTVLNLALALNFLETLKDMAKVFRWRILANRPFTPREVDLILGGESLMKLSTLMWESLRPLKFLTVLVSASWIFLNLLAQGTIAMLSLNYSMDSGTNTSGIYTQPGTVNAARLDCYVGSTNSGCPSALGPPMITAHSYGELIAGDVPCPYQDDSDILKADQSCFYFNNNNGRELAYRYVEYNPTDNSSAYPYLTNRTIKASVGDCYQYDVDFPVSPLLSSQDGIQDIQALSFSNGSFTGNLPIPKMDGAYNSTTYVYNGTDIPQARNEVECGDRCLTMYAYRLNNNGTAHIFSCPITIGEVENARQDWHNVSNGNARLAIASIALTGRDVGSAWQQYQLYTWGSFWEAWDVYAWTVMDPQDVGNLMATFAIGSLANMAYYNPYQLKPGTLPVLGYHLDNHWSFIIALAICIGVAHCVLVLAILWSALPIVVLDDSDLTTARLLHNLVGKVEGHGSALDGKRLAEELQKKIVQENQNRQLNDESEEYGKLVYGVSGRDDVIGERVLDLGTDVMVRKNLKGGRFPRGIYD